jgi:hypothetical protein
VPKGRPEKLTEKRTTVLRFTRRLGLAAGVAVAIGLGTVIPAAADSAPSPDAIPTFQEFEASTYQDADGSYIVNGDEPITDRGELREFYDDLIGTDHVTNGLAVNTINGVDDIWSDAEVSELSYCVSTDFGARHDDIVSTMASATELWRSQPSKIDFIYDSSADADCTTGNASVTFSVEPVETSKYIARAFFPSDPKSKRNILIDDSVWTHPSWTPTNILGHEIGHVLGLRHEHIRPEAGTCFENDNWRPLTDYDSSSIMHYPQCNGTSADLSMSDTDRAGILKLYGFLA